MRIVVGSDHAGFELKEAVRQYLIAQGHQVEDQGAHDGQISVDYPDYALAVARAVVAEGYDCGMVFCGTGIGVSITANKVRGVRAALCTDPYMAQMARAHNNANILALGGRVVGVGLALAIVDAFLATPFAGGRHADRVKKITTAESFDD